MPTIRCASCNSRIPSRKSGKATHLTVGRVGQTIKEYLNLDVDGLVCITCYIRISGKRNRDEDEDEECTSTSKRTNLDDKSKDDEVVRTKPEESASTSMKTSGDEDDLMEEDIFGKDAKGQGT